MGANADEQRQAPLNGVEAKLGTEWVKPRLIGRVRHLKGEEKLRARDAAGIRLGLIANTTRRPTGRGGGSYWKEEGGSLSLFPRSVCISFGGSAAINGASMRTTAE
jgi:hypothetical protein